VKVVHGEGPSPCNVMLVGEAPGQHEAEQGRPFVGRTGVAQDRILRQVGLTRSKMYITNLKKNYDPGNPQPTARDVVEWGPTLLKEIADVNPRFIIATGAHSIRFFLGPDAHIEAVHGIPHHWDGVGASRTILPTYHPAAHFYSPDILAHTIYDYSRAAAAIRGKLDVDTPIDRHPNPIYYDLDDLSWDWYIGQLDSEIALDTEGVPGAEWSVQVSVAEGTGFTLRRSHPKYARAIKLLRTKLRKLRPTILIHSALYDVEMCLGLGLDFLDDLSACPIYDSMMAAYIMCVEPQSLKMLARRHCGMVMREYEEVIGTVGTELQLAWLDRALELTRSWPKPEARVEKDNDGTTRVYQPQPIARRIEAILVDFHTGKKNNKGAEVVVNPRSRWRKCDRDLRLEVEAVMGKMPIGTLADVPLPEAIAYAGRDPDATLRVCRKMRTALASQPGGTKLMDLKMRMLRAAVAMKVNGILGRRSAFEALSEEMDDKCDLIRDRISRTFLGGRKFNPMSSDQTAELMRRRGLKGEKKTKSGKMSTSKKSIEHLRFQDESIEELEQWREHSKIRSSFTEPVLEHWPGSTELVRVKCDLKITRVSSGRFSAALLDDQPSAPLLAIPVRSDLGKAVRGCYEAEEGYLLGSYDLDQAEMRLMADESNDRRLVHLFNDGKIDIHTDTAAKIFKLEVGKVDKMKHRYPAKRVGFGVITGIQGPGLLDQLRMAGISGWTVKQCTQLINDWLDLYPGVATYMEECRSECRRNGGIVYDRWGMPRHLPQILNETDEGFYERLEAERQTHSHRIQGGAQGYLQNVMAYLWTALRPYGDLVRFLLQIHDELIFEVHEDIHSEVGEVIHDAMVNHGGTRLKVPVKSSGSWARTWDKLKD